MIMNSNSKFHHHFKNTPLRVGLELKALAWETRALWVAHQWWVNSTKDSNIISIIGVYSIVASTIIKSLRQGESNVENWALLLSSVTNERNTKAFWCSLLTAFNYLHIIIRHGLRTCLPNHYVSIMCNGAPIKYKKIPFIRAIEDLLLLHSNLLTCIYQGIIEH